MQTTSQQLGTLDSQGTTESTSTTPRPDELTRYRPKESHPRWLGKTPRLPFPPGTMFGSLRLLSDELFRVSSIRQSGKRKGRPRVDLYARCLCTLCGTTVSVPKSNLLLGKTTQCKKCNVHAGHVTFIKKLWGGMIPDEFDRQIKTRWDGIKRRCEDPTSKNYARYGGRGIKLSDEFQDPRVFVEYVKTLPNASPELEIDRRDNNRGYERGNLRWVDRKTNVNNQERSI